MELFFSKKQRLGILTMAAIPISHSFFNGFFFIQEYNWAFIALGVILFLGAGYWYLFSSKKAAMIIKEGSLKFKTDLGAMWGYKSFSLDKVNKIKKQGTDFLFFLNGKKDFVRVPTRFLEADSIVTFEAFVEEMIETLGKAPKKENLVAA